MEFIEISAKTVNDAITEACRKLTVTSDKLDYEVVEEGSSGFLGIGSKPAVIKARVKSSVDDKAKIFLTDVFEAMNLTVVVKAKYDEAENSLDIDLSGDEMGVLIGKRGQTLDSLQYLVSLVVNKDAENYIRVKVDTENYRQRRKDTLENLAKNMAYKVKRTKRPLSLEPMNPYERRIIHSALQNDKFVETYSEGEEPYRKVVINVKKGVYEKRYPNNNSNSSNNSNNNRNSGGYRKDNAVTNKNYKKPYNTSKSGYNKNYSADYKKDYEKYKESKEKKRADS